jgi:two-component system CheB/CheR fusion protein
VSDQDFESLLHFIRSSRSFDLTGYKRTTLRRRFDRRMQVVGAETHAEYLDHLQVHPEEFGFLFDMVLINVTSFFRDEAAWTYLSDEVVPAMLAGKPAGSPIRVWSAGCASGEEAYTLAIVLAEALGAETFLERVKIYGTDVDEDALSAARHGTFDDRQIRPVPDDLRDRYFERVGSGWVFRRDLRRAVIFGRHDLTANAPISRLDLLVCRNTLMYFNSEAQDLIIARFRFGLLPGGHLFLGKAETLLAHSGSFHPVDLRHRIFQRIDEPRPRVPDFLAGPERPAEQAAPGATSWVEAFGSAPTAQIIIDGGGTLVAANDRSRALFRLNVTDVGRPIQDLELSYRPVELRSVIQQVDAEGRPVELTDVAWMGPLGDDLSLRVTVTPIRRTDDHRRSAGVILTFVDETRHRRLEHELEASNRQLEAAYEELQSTNEELETTNEELQSTIEELETTNEELQSTNEELETMNEELQSANEEMHTINDELRDRSTELNEVNTYLTSILAGLQAGVIVVDNDLVVRIWNRWSEEEWGLRTDEVVGKNIFNLDIGLPVEELREPLRRLVNGDVHETRTLDALNRRGRPVRLQIELTSLPLAGGRPGVMVLSHRIPASEEGEAPAQTAG